jgi:hypothetical protein
MSDTIDDVAKQVDGSRLSRLSMSKVWLSSWRLRPREKGVELVGPEGLRNQLTGSRSCRWRRAAGKRFCLAPTVVDDHGELSTF